MPTNKPKLFHLQWKETTEYSAIVETEWTAEEIQAHALSSEYSDDDGQPIWHHLIEEQILDPKDHVVSKDMEYVGAHRVDPLTRRADDLPRDKMIAIINNIREEMLRKPDLTTHQRIIDVFVHCGFDTRDEGVWGVLDCKGQWIVHNSSEDTARAFYEVNEGTWKLVSSIAKDNGGDEHFVTMDEREQNAPEL